MTLVDSNPAPDAVSAAGPALKRAGRARRAAAPAAVKDSQIQPIPRWARDPGPTPEAGATAFFAGARLALFDAVLRGCADPAEPVFAGCLRQRLALKAAETCATLARLREDAGGLRDAEHLAGGSETSPAGRIHRLFRRLAGRPAASLPARVDAAVLRVAGRCSGCQRRSTPARSPPPSPRRPTRSCGGHAGQRRRHETLSSRRRRGNLRAVDR